MARIEDMMHKMMRRFDATDENVKEMRNDLSGISQKVHYENSAENDLVQRSTDPIDGPSIHPRTVDGVRRTQIPSMRPRLRTVDQVCGWMHVKISQNVKQRRRTTVRRLIYGPFCTSVVAICDQYCWSSDPRKGSTDRISVYGPSATGSTSVSESAHAWGSKSSHASGSESAHASGSNAKSSTGSSQNEQAASSDEATSSESVPVPRNENPTPVAGESNRWCVEGQWQIYRDTKVINDKEKMARLITEECRVLTGSLHTVPDIHQLFNLHKCDWMAQDPGTYSEDIEREFYASYAATLRGSISKRSKPIAQDPLTSTMDIVRSGAFQRNAEQREVVTLWLAKYIVADGECAEWVATPQLGIRKATLNFVAKFFWLLVRNRMSPTQADNQLTWDRVVMVVALVAGLEIDFARMLLAEIHEKAFKTSTTYPFLWTLDIGLIRDEANVAAPRREPQVEVPPLGADFADTVGQAQGSDPIIPDHTDTIPAYSSQAASRAPSSYRSTPLLGSVVVPLRVLKRPAPTIDLSSFQSELASLRADVDAILATSTVEPQAAPHVLADDTVLDALFSGTAEEGPEPTHTKGASSSAPVVEVPPVVRDIVSTTDGAVRVTESTTEGAMMDDVGITEGDPSMVPAGSGKPDPPTC
uniref:Integrase core domain containing protein n=1 Tax=Solanum tuberosum TaxID=4113 RepID=M1DTH6_SOLTU